MRVTIRVCVRGVGGDVGVCPNLVFVCVRAYAEVRGRNH
jgi:hypothetical protein